MKELHLFDFDGTLTKKDSLFDFLKFIAPQMKPSKSFSHHFVLSLPIFFKAYTGFIEKGKAKEVFIKRFIGGQEVKYIEELAEKYAENIHGLMRSSALEYIEKLQKDPEKKLVLVSASLDIWLKPIAERLNFELICTKAEVIKGKYTGNFLGQNCNLEEKERRVLDVFELKDYQKVVAYGDTMGDRFLLKLADESHFKPFH